jgi:hypothetical protein
MSVKRAVIAGMLLVSVWCPAWARPDMPKEVRQTNFNATLICNSPEELSARLGEVAQKHKAVVNNFNLDSSSSQASANLQCPPSELNGLIADLTRLGRVENQSRSSSDYTSSYRDAANRVQLYEAVAQVPLDTILRQANLSPTDQALVRAELQQMMRERIQSYQSSMQSYLDYNNKAQLSIQFRFSPAEAARPVATPTPGTTPEASTPAPTPAAPVNQGTLLPLYLLGFVNLTFLWLLARRGPSAPAVTPAPPGTHD